MRPESVRQPVPSTDVDEHPAIVPATRFGDQLYDSMAAMIERGDYGEGGRLPAESELAERFGVSRPVVREALARLRATGLIVSRKGSGSYVRKRHAPLGVDQTRFGPVGSLAEVKQCYEFRVGLEGEAAFCAARHRDEEALSALRTALERLDTAIADGAVGMSADFEFHLAVARASGNDFFETVMLSMRIPIEFAINLARSLSLTRPREHRLTVQAEHVALFEAIEAGDAEAARRAMRAHIENTRIRVFEGAAAQG
jgi:GntR family transcriptional regulator, transcriptional repressor for pyruvate dehydrogenase complex